MTHRQTLSQIERVHQAAAIAVLVLFGISVVPSRAGATKPLSFDYRDGRRVVQSKAGLPARKDAARR